MWGLLSDYAGLRKAVLRFSANDIYNFLSLWGGTQVGAHVMKPGVADTFLLFASVKKCKRFLCCV